VGIFFGEIQMENHRKIQPQEPESPYFCWGDTWNCTKPYFNAETDVFVPDTAVCVEEQSNQEDEE
jgi:hypothetical protein